MELSYPRLNGDIPLVKAQLIAHFIEVVLYGIECLLFVIAMYLWAGTERGVRWTVQFFVMLLMFLISTIHVGTSLDRILAGFFGPSVDPVAYFIELWHLSYRLKNIYLVLELVLLDIFIIYQCYMIWDKRKRAIAFPLLTLVCYIVSAIGCIEGFARMAHPNDSTPGTMSQEWMLVVLSITLFIKLLCIGLAVAGSYVNRTDSDWQISYIVAKGYGFWVTNVLIGLQSGVLVMLTLLVAIPVYAVGSNIQDIILDLLSPLTGISFFLILMFSFIGYIPSGGQPSRRSRVDGMLENHRRLPRIAISVDVEAYQSEPSESPIEARKADARFREVA